MLVNICSTTKQNSWTCNSIQNFEKNKDKVNNVATCNGSQRKEVGISQDISIFPYQRLHLSP